MVGALLLPIYCALYFTDRAICVLLPTTNSFHIKIWFNDVEELKLSIIRVFTILVIVSLVLTFKYLFV